MICIFVNLDPDDKARLDREAWVRNMPVAKWVRQAVRGCRGRHESEGFADLQITLHRTADAWERGDSLRRWRRLCSRWDGRR